MATSDGRQRGVWMLGAGVALVAVCGLIGLYFWWSQPRFDPDPKLLEELAAADLLDDPTPPTTDWPQWRGELRDGVAHVADLRTDWPEDGLPVLWRTALDGGQSSMAVADGKVVTMTQHGDDELVLCLDAASGREAWRFAYPARFNNPQVQGPSSTPTIAGGRVFTVGATGLFHGLDAATGKKLWAHDLLKEFNASNLRWGTSFSPLVDGDLVVTNPGGSRGQSVAAFKVDSGELAWKALDDPAGYSSPIAATIGGVRQAIVFTGDHLSGLRMSDGKALWRYPWTTQHQVNAATPLVIRARGGERELTYVLISSSYDKGCALVKVEEAGGSFTVGTVYAGNQLKSHFSSYVRIGGHVYGFDDDKLACLELKTGKVLWRERGFGKGTLLLAGRHLLVLSDDGRLALVEPSPERFQETASWQALEGQCWSAPALAGGKLYVRNQKELLCIDITKK